MTLGATSAGWCWRNPSCLSLRRHRGGSLAAALAIALTSFVALISTIVHVFEPVAYDSSLACMVTACALVVSCAPRARVR